MLTATPRSMFSWDFTAYEDGIAIADIDMAWFGERAEVTIKGCPYCVRRESVLEGTFALKRGDEVLARAVKPSMLVRAFEVEFAERRLEMQALAVWSNEFGLFDAGAQIGRIGRVRWFGWETVIDLPNDIALPVQVFLFWLVLILWRRAQAAQ